MNPGPEKLLNCCLNLVAVTETWLNPSDTASMFSDITPHGYKWYHEPQPARRGGGVGFLVRNNLDFKVLPHVSSSSFEHVSVSIASEGSYTIDFQLVYRPPRLSKATFLEDFEHFVEGSTLSHHENVILGDINFHLDITDAST